MHPASSPNSSSAEKFEYSQLEESGSEEHLLSAEGSVDGAPPRRQSWSSGWKLRCAIVLVLLFGVCNFIFAMVMWSKLSAQNELRTTGDVDGLAPAPEWEKRMFHDTGIKPGAENDKAWEDDNPTAGFVIIRDFDKYGLPPGQAYSDGNGGIEYSKFGISWAHQYHCLWMLKQEFWRFVYNESTLVHADIRNNSGDTSMMWHLAHCYDYIRQAVVCNMDMTLEWPTLGGVNQGTINGYGIEHVCKKRGPQDEFMSARGPLIGLEVDPFTHELRHLNDEWSGNNTHKTGHGSHRH